MSQSAPAEPIVTSPYQPSPPLGALVAAIREYVSAVQLGEDKNRRLDLSRRVWQLCWTCRPKHGEREMRFTNGMLAHVVLDYSTTHVEWKDSEKHVVSSLSRGRRHADMPSELDRELDRIEDEMTRAGIEAAYDIRMPDENGRPLPVPAIDRLLVIADRIESQEGNDGSAAGSDVEVKPSTVTDDAASIEAKVPSENGVLNETSVDTHGDEHYVLQSDDVLILAALEGAGQAMTHVEIETYDTAMPSRSTIGRRLERLRNAGYIRRPHGDRGGDTITDDGKAALKKTSRPDEH